MVAAADSYRRGVSATRGMRSLSGPLTRLEQFTGSCRSWTLLFGGIEGDDMGRSLPVLGGMRRHGIVKHPGFHAHLVTCDRCAARPVG
jgi:hypothetical protein